MNYAKALTFLTDINHLDLLKYFDELSVFEQKELLKDLQEVNDEFFSACEKQKIVPDKTIYPVKNFEIYHSLPELEKPTFSQKGGVGTVIFAGGQGSRLGFEGPKGCFPLSLIKNKTTFQIFAEKTLYASQASGHLLQLAIMTSSFNHLQTVTFFKENNYFGLQKEQIHFFQQSNSFMKNGLGKYFLDSKSSVAKSPGGNGTFFESFVKSGLFDLWKNIGIKAINVIPVDNPLADPFDFKFFDYHLKNKNEISLKCISRTDPNEKVGIIVKNYEQKVIIKEYNEIDDIDKFKKDINGHLEYNCANTGMICFSLEFIKKAFNSKIPYHLAHKKAAFLDDNGHLQQSKTPNAYKREKFIFDTFPLSEKTGVVLCKREECFAPLKNNEGIDSIESVQKSMLKRDRLQWNKVVSEELPFIQFELSQEFYYRQKKIEQWQYEGFYIFLNEKKSVQK